MTVLQFRSPVTTPLHRRGQCTAASDDFCVTQQFSDPDYYQSQLPPDRRPDPLPTHNATDIGNFRCGYPIVAMASGTAWRVQDNATALGAATNALGIVIDHGSGVQSAYWHLASWTAPNGSWVNPSQEIGRLGNTGLLATCHCHIELFLNRVRIDPEPHMFGAPLDTAVPTSQEDPMFNPPDVLAIDGVRLRSKAGARIRERQGTSYPILSQMAAGTEVTATVRVVGEPANGSIEWWGIWVEIAGQVRIGFGHVSAFDVIPTSQPSQPADCTEEVKVATAAGYLDAKTKARLAVEGI